MMCDVRPIHPDDVIPLIKRFLDLAKEEKFTSIDSHGDGERWYLNLETHEGKFNSCGNWVPSKDDSESKVSAFYFEFYPKNQGLLRFDGHYNGKYDDEIMKDYNLLLRKHANAGVNRMKNYINLKEESKSQAIGGSDFEIILPGEYKSFWQKIKEFWSFK